MSSYNREALREVLIAELRRRQRATDALDEAVAGQLKVNRTDLRCLDVLLDQGSATPGQLADALGLTTGSVTTMLDRLEALGYVRREPEPSDRRRINVRPTTKVLETAGALYGPLVEDGMRFLARYRAADLQLLVDFSRRERELQEAHAARIRALSARAPRSTRKRAR